MFVAQRSIATDTYLPVRIGGIEEEVYFLLFWDSAEDSPRFSQSKHFRGRAAIQEELIRMGRTKSQADHLIAYCHVS
jgi:hypothetical protein